MKDIIKQIILENQEKNIVPLKRDLNIPETDKVISLIGLRRVGKTHLFFYKINELIKNGIKKNCILYLNFDDERLLNFNIDNFQDIIDSYNELFPENSNKLIYLFFDEIQDISNWEKFIRRLSENKTKYRIFITGSSSKLLSSEIATSLRGRTLPYFLYPLSFNEYLRFNNIYLEKNYEYSNQRYLLIKSFQNYISNGGFPETIKSNLSKEILQSYIDLIIYKDLIERYNLKNLQLLKNLINFSLTNISKIFSINSYYNSIKENLKVSRETIIEYVGYLEDINFLFLVYKYDPSLKKQNTSLRKVYSIDTGMSNFLSFKFSRDKGRLLENLVFIELKRQGKEIYYHKQKKECDFVIKEGLDIVSAIQVTQFLDDIETKKREIEGLLDALNSYNLKEGLILTEDEKGEEIIEGKKIIIMPIWKWLLENPKGDQ